MLLHVLVDSSVAQQLLLSMAMKFNSCTPLLAVILPMVLMFALFGMLLDVVAVL